jgi:hypothetical protein
MTEKEIKEFVADTRRKAEIFRNSGFATTGITNVFDKSADIIEELLECKANVIDEFAHQLKENLNQEFPSNYESTRPYFSLENARLIVDDVAEQMKAGGIDG